MSNKSIQARTNHPSRTPVIIIGSIAGSLIVLAMAGSLLYLFSRKERARRRNAQQNDFSPIQPPAYKAEELGLPRGQGQSQRPLSSFAPDYSRQAQYHHHLSQSSYEQPPPYPTLPTYDPSQYQPIRPTSMVGDMHNYAYYPNPPIPHPGPSSRLSAVHYDARLSTYRPVSVVEPAIGPVAVAAAPRPGQPKPRPPRQDVRRERSFSEPLLSGQPAGPKQPKPVLSRLITNFR